MPFWFTLTTLCLFSVAVGAAEPVDYLRDVKPVLKERCYGCHAALKQEGGLRLDTAALILKGGDSGPAIKAGDLSGSEIIARVTSKDTSSRMPPEGDPLKPEEIAALREWITQGAHGPDYETPLADPRQHWAYQRFTRPSVPTATNGSTHPVDAFIDQRLAAIVARRQAPAERATLIRRMFLDVTGLPPTPERVQAFIKDASPDAVPQLIEELLASPRYGERWAQHWLDVVRYADTHGFEVNTPREHAWPYRDYVIRSFNEDKPYDQFVREQIAGDTFQQDAATGFLVASAVLLPGQIGADEESKRAARQDALDEIIVGTTSTILGITLGCARCHDHKFDPLTQRDYYAMQGFFAGVEYGDRPMFDANSAARQQAADALDPAIADLEERLREYEPRAFAGKTLIIDELDSQRVTFLKKANGPGNNPQGDRPGYEDDVGDAQRVNNISGGRYHWWNNVPGEDVLTYQPGVAGRYQLWISWGAHGSGVHTRDARYVIDADGDLATTADQRELARVDQYYPAGVNTGETEQKPLWSGLQSLGILEWTPMTKLILRSGDTGSGITADVIVLQENADQAPRALPHLRDPVNARENVERFAPVNARFVRFTTFETINQNEHEPCLDELEVYGPPSPHVNLALSSRGTVATSSGNFGDDRAGEPHRLRHIHDGQYGNNRSWISNQRGGGWVQLELRQSATIERIVWGRDRQEKLKDRLPVRYEITVSDDGETWQRVAGHEDRGPLNASHEPHQTLLRHQPAHATEVVRMVSELERLDREREKLETPQMVYAGTFREPDTTYVLRRGDAEQRLGEIAPAVPAIFHHESESGKFADQERRLALAQWLSSPHNPLTARVMVNRLWQGHFGRGLVETPNDFGVNGVLPTHPELLDWLACEFMEHGWSIKHMHRLILSSKTYQQAATWNTTSAEVDRDNRLLWRFPSRRLEGEAVRDSLLLLSGELNLTMGGPGFNFFQTRGGLNGFPPMEQFTSNEMRRMIYQHKVRMEPVPVFGAFDCPDAGQSMPKRSRSTTAIQALNLFNSPFVIDRAEQFAARVMREKPSSSTEQVQRAFALALARPPSSSEQAVAVSSIENHGLVTLCRVLINSNEFLFLP
ncbi:MAG TPA: DUF1553 domain-containing protein [Planctomycetaceae bacterium]|nr:DUF1553 domain-containing protein [Planctomycetaceae bacterium]